MAFRRLAGVLAGAGDNESAVFKWHHSYALTIYNNESNGKHGDSVVENSTICKGCHRFIDISNILICRCCQNAMLCAPCLQLRRSERLAVNICSKKHDWVLLSSLPQAVRQRSEEQKDMVFVGERWISLDELKRQLTLVRKERCMKVNHWQRYLRYKASEDNSIRIYSPWILTVSF